MSARWMRAADNDGFHQDQRGDSPLIKGWSTTVRQHERSERAHRRERPPAQLHSTDDVLLRDESPVAAVRAVVPVITHHEVVPLRNNLRPPIVVAAILGD